MSPLVLYSYIWAEDRCECVCVKWITKKKNASSWATHHSHSNVHPQEWDSRNKRCLGQGGGRGILVRGLHSCQGFSTACSQQQEQNKSPTRSACVEDSPQSTPTASVGGLHLPFPVIWSHCVWGQDSGRDIKVVIKMGGGTKRKGSNRIRQGEETRKDGEMKRGRKQLWPWAKRGWGKCGQTSM